MREISAPSGPQSADYSTVRLSQTFVCVRWRHIIAKFYVTFKSTTSHKICVSASQSVTADGLSPQSTAAGAINTVRSASVTITGVVV